jgi:fibronectin type 3 domain-containing protein
MKTASLGRRLGDWLGIVADDEIALSEAPVSEEIGDKPEDPSPPRESAPDERVVQNARPSSTTTASRRRVRRAAPTAEFRAEVIAWRAAVSELRAGLDMDDDDNRH